MQTRESITFEFSASYFQKQNKVSKRIKKTIIDMIKTTILEDNIDKNLWPELILAIIYIKNN